MKRVNRWIVFLSFLYFIFYILYCFYSYSQIDLNLTLSSNSLYQSFQKSMIQLGYFNRLLSTLIYSLIIFILYTLYFILYTIFKKGNVSIKAICLITGLTIGILLFAYPAFSHDIFNYIFNAKMVLVYHKNPHINTASEFPHDLWTRFMHNVHTPAPYFYGWTLISLIPSFFGFGKLTLNLLTFKLFLIPFFVWQIFLLNKILDKLLPEERKNRLFLFILNPLVLIETFGNGHNDVTMTSLALLSFWFLIKKEKIDFRNLILSVIFLFFSASIKYVTIILLPIYLTYGLRKCSLSKLFFGFFKKNKIMKRFKGRFWGYLDISGIAAIFLFLAIFSRPQDQFHPWYLIWSLSFAVFSRNKWVLNILLFFSFSLMLRYTPLLYFGVYNKQVMGIRTMITYSIPAILFLILVIKELKHRLSFKFNSEISI